MVGSPGFKTKSRLYRTGINLSYWKRSDPSGAGNDSQAGKPALRPNIKNALA